MKKWLNLWPTQSVTGLGYAVSGNSKVCTRKMRTFIKDIHNMGQGLFEDRKQWTPEKVMEAIYQSTVVYLDARRNNNWDMTMKNSNFINHQEKGSMLESYMILYAQGKLHRFISSRSTGTRI
jgi:hypothetical protein